MRSTLLFLVGALVLPVRGEGQAREGGSWQLITPRSVGADQPSITLELDALNVVRTATVSYRPALLLRCLNEKLEAFVATRAARNRDADYRTTVRLRWADRPPVEETWQRSTDYAAVFAPDAAAMIRQLLATPEMTVELLSDDMDPTVARFNGAGLDAHLPTLRTRCRGFTDPRGVESDSVYAETQVDERAELLSIPDADYPPMLRRAGIQGTVIVQAVVDTRGRVVPGSLRVLSSANPGFNESALKALQQAVFRPARVHGRPVKARLRLPIEFHDGGP